jgi:hypothetical protein
MEVKTENKVMSHLTKGLILSLILIVLNIVARVTKSEQASWFTWVSNIILIAGIIWACISYANDMNRAVTFGNVFAHGFKTTAVITVIMIVFTVIYFLVFPEIKEEAMVLGRQKLEEQGQLTDDQIDTALGITQKFFLPITIGSIMLIYLFIGVCASLVGAALAKKNPPTPFGNQA